MNQFADELAASLTKKHNGYIGLLELGDPVTDAAAAEAARVKAKNKHNLALIEALHSEKPEVEVVSPIGDTEQPEPEVAKAGSESSDTESASAKSEPPSGSPDPDEVFLAEFAGMFAGNR